MSNKLLPELASINFCAPQTFQMGNLIFSAMEKLDKRKFIGWQNFFPGTSELAFDAIYGNIQAYGPNKASSMPKSLSSHLSTLLSTF